MGTGLALTLGLVLGALIAGLAAAAWAGWVLAPRTRAAALAGERDTQRREAEAAARDALGREREAFAAEQATARREVKELEGRARGREDAFDRRIEGLEERERALRVREAELTGKQAALEAERAEVERTVQRNVRELERISGMRREEAEHLLLERVEARCADEARAIAARAELALAEEADRRGREALLSAIGRAAWSQTHEPLVTAVPLPDDEAKALLIGRDARNVRTFQALTGVDLLVDDTPGVVVLSSFDPVRREVARRALGKLLDEGRIHPQRIEELVVAARAELEEVVVGLGREAAREAHVEGLHPRLEALLGRLEFRTAEGDNVRLHSVEAARLAGLLAGELGLDPVVARRAGLLHDIGQAVDHEQDGGHAALGADFARRCGEADVVVDAIAHHHDPVQASSPIAALVQLANALSTRRPGARDGQLEAAIRRRSEVEAIALRHAGVERAWAVQAGRELRVVVDPAKVGDKAAIRLARDVARALEAAAVGPGEVKVTVIREVRVEETAR